MRFFGELFIVIVFAWLIVCAGLVERARPDCQAPITLTDAGGRPVYVVPAQVTQVASALKAVNPPSARAIIVESSGIQQAVREAPEVVAAMLHCGG